VERLKILVFNWRCWLNPEKGGAEGFTYEVLKRWVKDGHDVTLFTSKFEGSSDEEIVDRVRIVRREGNYWRDKTYYKKFSKEGCDVIIDEINTRFFMASNFVKNAIFDGNLIAAKKLHQ